MDFPQERGRLGMDMPESCPDTQPEQQPVLPLGPRPLPTPPESREPSLEPSQEPSQEPLTLAKWRKKQRDYDRIAQYNRQKKAERRAKQEEKRLAKANPLSWVPAKNWNSPKVHLRQWTGFLRASNEDTHSEDDESPKTKRLCQSKFVDAEFFDDGKKRHDRPLVPFR